MVRFLRQRHSPNELWHIILVSDAEIVGTDARSRRSEEARVTGKGSSHTRAASARNTAPVDDAARVARR